LEIKKAGRKTVLNTNRAQKTEVNINQDNNQYVIFTLGSQEFGIDVLDSREIITAKDLTVIPDSPDFVRGVINLREEIIPVIDLTKRFNLRKQADNNKTKVIIVSVNNTLIGLGVNDVEEIIRINDSNISEAPEITQGVNKDYIQGIARLKDRLLILIDIKSIFSKDEMEELQDMDVE
jgi:purine-binding chemotaxis protein CheW